MRSGSLALMLAAALVAIPSTPSPAAACANGVLATRKTVAAVQEAERILDDGDPKEALRRVRALLGRVPVDRRAKVDACEHVMLSDGYVFDEQTPSSRGLTRRAQRILALANVRLDACAGHGREDVLDDAVGMLRYLIDGAPNDAARQTDLGEALAKRSPRSAKRILESLAGRDVLATPYAYAALARMRAGAGDEKGSDDALRKCRLMAKTPKICGN